MTCLICHQPFFGDAAPGTSEVIEFDRLAARMVDHIDRMHARQSGEMLVIMRQAAKVYAMTWAEDSSEVFERVRESWRAELLTTLRIIDAEETQAAAPAAPTAGELPL